MRNPHHLPRRAYCTGCRTTFPMMHMLINHRRTDRCGGRFLPEEEQLRLSGLRWQREEEARREREKLSAV